MKNFAKLFLCFTLLLILPVIALTGCGENLIQKREYNMINMQVIKDQTEFDGYVPFSDGDFTSVYCGVMEMSNSTIDVKENKCILKYVDQSTKVSATFDFDRYNDTSEFPAFKFSDFKIYLDETDITNEDESSLNSLDTATKNQIISVLQFKKILQSYDSSIQIVTTNKSFVSHIILKTESGNLAFMSVLYGY